MKPGSRGRRSRSAFLYFRPPANVQPKLWIWNVVHLIMIRVASTCLSFYMVSFSTDLFTPSPPWTVSEFLLADNYIQNGFSSSPSSSAAVSCVSPHIEVLLPPFLPPLLPLDGCSRMYLLFLRTILSKFFGGARSKFFEGSVSAITTHLFSLFAA